MAKKSSDVEAQAEAPIALYNKVVDSAELHSIQLMHVDFDVDARFFSSEGNDTSLGYEITYEDDFYDGEEGFAACIINFEVEAKDDGGSILLCNAKYTVSYRVAPGCDSEAVKRFLRRVGVFACYPYFRSLFASLDWSANTRLPPLPIHKENVASPPKKKPAKKKTRSKAVVQAEVE